MTKKKYNPDMATPDFIGIVRLVKVDLAYDDVVSVELIYDQGLTNVRKHILIESSREGSLILTQSFEDVSKNDNTL